MTAEQPKATPPIGFIVFTLLALTVTLYLGMLQLKRATWEEVMVHRFDVQKTKHPVALPRDTKNYLEHAFMRIEATGRFVSGKSVLVSAKRGREAPGYRLLTLFEPDAGPPVFVDRGWLPPSALADDNPAPAGTVTISGIIRIPEPRDLFMPGNEQDKGVWRLVAPQQIAEYFGLEGVRPYYLQLAPGMPAPVATAAPGHPPPPITERHRLMAYGWFAVGGVVVLVFIYRMCGIRRQAKKEQP
ncbi:MAG: SURF1 family protein [Rhodospirillales bacterium]|nr:SURF1 family protein [Rhodospirillales bacterium]